MTREVSGAECDVAVIGLGFVGLPAAIMAARAGLQVIGVDTDAAKVAAINEGRCPIIEPGLAELFEEASANLSARARPPIADIYIIAVPTPLTPRRFSSDLTALMKATESLVPVLAKGALVIVESTIPPLTCSDVVAPILARSGLRPHEDFHIAHCPERLFPGNAVHEIVHNDRIIGGCAPRATERATAFYAHFVRGELAPTDDVTAEFCKLAENTYRYVNIGLANELAMVAEKIGAKAGEAFALANRHPRVDILTPGIGVGGHCLPIDPLFLTEVAPEETVIIPAAHRINGRMPEITAAKARRFVAEMADPLIGCAGVTYKPDVDDQRESPAWEVIELLRADGYRVELYDPVAHVGEAASLEAFALGLDALVILVEHEVFAGELAAAGADSPLTGVPILRF